MLPKFILTAALVASHVAATNRTAEYDYVIVGSGPGGGSLAANLATQGYSIFLIEAGGDQSDSVFQSLPLLSARAADSSPHAWQFFVDHYSNETQARRDSKYTYRQTNGSYYVGRNPPAGAEPLGVYYPRGATLGGSSQVNAMNFAWAPDNEWDYIANLTGDPSWNHEYLRQYLMALENCSYVPEGTPGHGFDGYIESSHPDTVPAVTPPRVRTYLSEMFRLAEGRQVDGIEEMAQLLRRDSNRLDNDRYAHNTMMTVPLAISNTTASRSSIAHYIRRVIAAGHPLTLSLHSLANRVLFEECDGKPKAFGVEYLVGEGLYSADMRYNASQTAQRRTVRARKEVIVAGGTFNTPQILKLSGVGPREELERWGIPVVVDLPAVGNYMQDNYEAPVIIRADVPWMNQTNSPCPFTYNASDPCYVQWQQEASGPYTQRPGTFTLTLRSSVSWDNDADLFYLSTAGSAGAGFWPGYSQRNSDPNSWATPIVKMQTGNAAGTVTLRSLDPRQAPAINLNFFSQNAERDLQALEEGINLFLEAHDNIGTNYTLVTPNPADGIRQGILDESFSHHASSSCRMGRVGDGTSCVDSKFRVHGVDGLRIVDASVFPRVPGAMPNGPTFTISYKAFVTIMEENRRKQAS